MPTPSDHPLSPSYSFLNHFPSPRSAMADSANRDTHASNGDDATASFLLTHPPLTAASAVAADPLSLSDSPDLAAANATNDSVRTNRSSNSPTGCGSGSGGGGGSSGNEASISNTSGDSENGGKCNADKSNSCSPSSPPTGPTGTVRAGGPSSSAGPEKLLDREHHPVQLHRSQHQSPARPVQIAGAAASTTGGSSDEATEGSGHLPPLYLREAVNSSTTRWSPTKLSAPVGRAVPSNEQGNGDAKEPLPFLAAAQTSSSTLPTVSSSTQATTSADAGPQTTPASPATGPQPRATALVPSSSTIASTTAGLSGRGSGKSRKSNGKPKPFVCDQCGIGFSRFQNLKSHMLTHQNVRPFPCEECGQAFSRLHDLKRHQRLHTGARPFTCSNCFRSFARLDALNRHRESNSCQNVNLPQSLRDVALAHAAMNGMASSGAAANIHLESQEDALVVTARKRGRPTRAQAAAALTAGAAGKQPAAENTNNDPDTAAAATADNNTSSSPPGGANGNRSSADSRPATSVSNSIVPSDSVSQQHARRGGGPGNSGQRNNQSPDSSDGPRPPALLSLQRPSVGDPGTASRDASPLDLLSHTYDVHIGGADMDFGAPPGRAVINAATESWRVQQRHYGGPPAMAPGPALQMWGSPPVPMYAGRAGGAAAARAPSLSPTVHQMDLASPLFLASHYSAEAGRKRRRGTSTSPVVGGTPAESQAAADKRQSKMGQVELAGGREFDGEGVNEPGPEVGDEMFGLGRPGANHRSAASHQRQQQLGRDRGRGTPSQAAGVGMSSASGANQSGSNSSAHIKGSTRTGGPMPLPNSSLGHFHSYQVHQAQSVDATVVAGGGDTSVGGTPQPPSQGSHQQHHNPQTHAGLEVMHRRLDMLMQDNLWLRSRITDLEQQSQADRMRMMEQEDQIHALLMERSMRRGGSQDASAGADGGGPDGSGGNSRHFSRCMPAPHVRSSSFLSPQTHGRYFDPKTFACSSPQQYFAEDAFGYPPMLPGLGASPHWSPAAASRGYPDLVDDVYRHGQPKAPPLPPSSARHPSRHLAYVQQPMYPSHQEHPRFDSRDLAAASMRQGHSQQLLQYPRYEDVAMNEELDYPAAAHVSKRRRVMSPIEGDHAGGGAPHQS